MPNTDNRVTLTLSNRLKVNHLPEPLREGLVENLTIVNPKWLENERMGRWNRNTPKILKFYRLTSAGGILLPRGYTRQLILLLKKNDLSWEIIDKRRTFPDINYEYLGQLRPFQKRAAAEMLAREFGTLCAPTGAGKTIIALYMIAVRRQPTMIVVHTKDLALQWIKQISVFLGIPEKEVGLLGGGRKTRGEKVTVALVQSLYKQAKEISQNFGHIVVDECHRAPSRTFTEALTAFDSKYMLGLSATPWRRDGLSKLIFWHLGDKHHEIEKTTLVQSGDVLPADVIFRETDFRPFHDPVSEYSKMLTELTSDDKRNRLIAEDVAKELQENPGVCLVLTDRKKHAETLHLLLRYKHHVESAILTGELSTGQRGEVLDALNNGKVKVLVATGQLIGEGFDCKELSTLFLATPIRFSGRVLQYLGRVLRPAPGKSRARVFDYVDVHVDVLCKAAMARQRIYSDNKKNRAKRLEIGDQKSD
jgi:superfamily II DNA or RNA helicase